MRVQGRSAAREDKRAPRPERGAPAPLDRAPLGEAVISRGRSRSESARRDGLDGLRGRGGRSSRRTRLLLFAPPLLVGVHGRPRTLRRREIAVVGCCDLGPSSRYRYNTSHRRRRALFKASYLFRTRT